jgi:hypothetical protein
LASTPVWAGDALHLRVAGPGNPEESRCNLDFLLFEMAGSPPYPDYDHWRQLSKDSQTSALEWLAAVDAETLGITNLVKTRLLNQLSADPRFAPRPALRPWSDTMLAFMHELRAVVLPDTRATVDDIVAIAEDSCWRDAVLRGLTTIYGSVYAAYSAREGALQAKMEEWKLSAQERQLFVLLDSTKETKQIESTEEPFARVGVSETYILEKLWEIRLKDLPSKKSQQHKNKLRTLQASVNRKIAKHRADLHIDRPRPGALALTWTPPTAQRKTNETAVCECVLQIRDMLTRVPSHWLPAHIICRHLRRYNDAEIVSAKRQIGIVSSREHYGREMVEIWRLPCIS